MEGVTEAIAEPLARAARLLEILISERIGRDLAVARKRNKKRHQLIERLKALAPHVDGAALADELGLRQLDIVPIRPAASLGGSFAGFFWPPRRARDIEQGKAAAVAQLPALRKARDREPDMLASAATA